MAATAEKSGNVVIYRLKDGEIARCMTGIPGFVFCATTTHNTPLDKSFVMLFVSGHERAVWGVHALSDNKGVSVGALLLLCWARSTNVDSLPFFCTRHFSFRIL